MCIGGGGQEPGPAVQVPMVRPPQWWVSTAVLTAPNPPLWDISGEGEAKSRTKANIGGFYFLRLKLLLPTGSWSFSLVSTREI